MSNGSSVPIHKSLLELGVPSSLIFDIPENHRGSALVNGDDDLLQFNLDDCC